MTLPDNDLVLQALRDPASLHGLSPRQADLLLRQAIRANLLARLAWMVKVQGLEVGIHPGLAAHLEGARRTARSHQAEVLREVEFIRRALEPLAVPIVLLKGAAYVMAGLPAARGRLFTDIDILVPRERLVEAEVALMMNGWVSTHHSAYDQRYYRLWMHELPPMVHLRRQTALDVHHAIAPVTARWRVDSAPLLAQALSLPGQGELRVLAPMDMVLHSIVHLMLNEELSHGLRDLSDIDLLLRHYGAEAAFWPRLTERAAALGLRRGLYHGLRSALEILGTPVPAATLERSAAWGPVPGVAALMRAAWRRALRSPHPSASDLWTPAALSALYVRAHWLRMPSLLLTRHLVVKALGLHKPAPSTDRQQV